MTELSECQKLIGLKFISSDHVTMNSRPGKNFTGHGKIWTRVQDPTCPVKSLDTSRTLYVKPYIALIKK